MNVRAQSIGASMLMLAATVMHVACSSTSEGTSSGSAPATTDGGSPPAADDAGSATPDSSTNPGGKLGTLTDKGVKSIDVDISSKGSWTCNSVCAAKNAVCKAGGNGAGNSSYKYDNGSGTFSSRISSCDETESYHSGNSTMTSMSCYCDGLPVPPTVRVKKSEGFHACQDVCETWSLTCAADRKSYAYTDEEEKGPSTVLTCDALPAETTHHYVCACAAGK